MRAAFILWIGLGLLMSSHLEAQTFEDGYQSYMRNQYPVAELQFKSALKKAKAKEDMAFIQKFIGICQYMRGDRNQAAATFYQALANDRNLAIDEEEVLDPSVVNFFNFLKNKWAKEPMAAAPRPNQAQTAAKSPDSPPPPAAQPKASNSLAAKAGPKTSLKARKKIAKNDAAASSGDEGTPAKSSRSRLSFWHFLPFGAGQFYNGSYWIGSGFALAETYTLYKYMDLDSQISERQGLDAQVRDNPGIGEERKEEFFLQNKSFISRLKKDQSLHLALFAGLWVGGVVDAVLRAPAPTQASSSKQKGLALSPRDSSTRFHGTWLPDARGGTWLVQLELSDPW